MTLSLAREGMVGFYRIVTLFFGVYQKGPVLFSHCQFWHFVNFGAIAYSGHGDCQALAVVSTQPLWGDWKLRKSEGISVQRILEQTHQLALSLVRWIAIPFTSSCNFKNNV